MLRVKADGAARIFALMQTGFGCEAWNQMEHGKGAP